MLFPTVDFAIFFTIVLCVSWLLRSRAVPWRLFIIGASWFFYGFWDARFVALLAASTAGNYVLGLAIYRSFEAARPATLARRGRELVAAGAGAGGGISLFADPVTEADRDEDDIGHGGEMLPGPWTRWLLAIGVGLNLAALGWFKYYEFFSTNLVNKLNDVGIDAPLPLLQITLPIGISFFTFQAISYLVDISRRQIKPMAPLDFATYLSFFPHLVAGPIVRASEFAPQLEQPMDPERIPATEAMLLIAFGLFKKVVISSYLAREIVDPVFAVPAQHSSFEILIATYAYAIQIFADFSGYTDIAIGCALLLGFRFPQNFNAPYTAGSLQEFWRRWHMTLSRWLRDYLYIPLGGSRGGWLFTWRNLLIVMVLGGLWHGAAWTFVAWGAIHGVGLVAERAITSRWDPRGRWWGVARWAITFHIVCLAWIFFRAESGSLALELLGRLFTAGGPAPLVSPLLLLVIAGALAVQFFSARWLREIEYGVSRLALPAQAALFALAIVLIDALGPSGVAPFIYFQF
jgi:D-alanyl-lipoteichoic acid acyltransferase DltB (MBOAT superfamily)